MALSPDARSRERRGNLIAVGVLLGALALLALLAYRPATVLGIDGESLAGSVGDELGISFLEGDCEQEAEDEWRCTLRGDSSSGGGSFDVTTRAFGCWDIERPSTTTGSKTSRSTSGCINAFHLL